MLDPHLGAKIKDFWICAKYPQPRGRIKFLRISFAGQIESTAVLGSTTRYIFEKTMQCDNVLQSITTYYDVLVSITTYYRVLGDALQSITTYCDALHRLTTCYDVLQSTTTYNDVL